MAKLYIVPTPIGNLEDITLRALRVLKEVDVVLAEDTRTSSVLLRHYDIHTPLRAHHRNNEHKSVDGIVQEIEGGKEMALISDAGTPGISDPGFMLARACRGYRRGMPARTHRFRSGHGSQWPPMRQVCVRRLPASEERPCHPAAATCRRPQDRSDL